MRNLTINLIMIAAVSIGFQQSVSAQSLTDTGKKKLTRLFEEATSTARRSTVRIKCDGQDAILGTIVSADGLILTKGSELRGEISCVMQDGSAYDADYIGYHRLSDLALIKVNAHDLAPIRFSESPAVVGNWVAVVGVRDEPIAVGVVSSPARKLYGEQSIIENANKGYMGIGLDDPMEGTAGVVISQILPGAAAEKAGLKVKDLIVEVAGKNVKDRQGLLKLMENYRPNDSITVKVLRGETSVDLKIKLGARGDFNRTDMQNSMGGSLSDRRTGFPSVIQHDTIVRPADCGGPLVDLDGKVLGINIARAGRVETWTIPSSVVLPILKELKAGKFAVSK